MITDYYFLYYKHYNLEWTHEWSIWYYDDLKIRVILRASNNLCIFLNKYFVETYSFGSFSGLQGEDELIHFLLFSSLRFIFGLPHPIHTYLRRKIDGFSIFIVSNLCFMETMVVFIINVKLNQIAMLTINSRK